MRQKISHKRNINVCFPSLTEQHVEIKYNDFLK